MEEHKLVQQRARQGRARQGRARQGRAQHADIEQDKVQVGGGWTYKGA